MRQRILSLAALLFLVSFSTGIAKGQSADEQAVRECALNYIEGWYSADTARLAKALAKDLAKKGFLLNPQSDKVTIAPASYGQMLHWTGQKPDQLAKKPDIQMEVQLIEVGEYIAMVKTITPDFIDYLQMGKVKGQWKIYHAVWERPPKE